jgi:hypothetical protein
MNFNRRNFMKLGGISLLAVPFAGSLLSGVSSKAEAADLPMTKETDAMAKSLKYCDNANKPSKNCADRKAKEKKDQFCHNCQLYTKISGEKEKEIGKCMLMPKSSVAGQGWCMSWVKKPG